MDETTTEEMMMTETTATEALARINRQMDAVYVDDNNSASHLADVVNTNEEDETRVVTEHEDGETIVLTRMVDGYRAGHYGTVYSIERAEKLGY